MNFQSMEYMAALARERSFTRAAEKLFITQQALSAHIAALEKELGCRLFVRRSPLQLTYAGELFLQYAQETLDRRDILRGRLGNVSRTQAGILRVGLSPVRSSLIIPRAIRAFHRRRPHVTVQLNENTYTLDSLEEGRNDLLIGPHENNDTRLASEDFYQEEILLAVRRELLDEAGVAPEELQRCIDQGHLNCLRDCPFVLAERIGSSFRVASQLFQRSDYVPRIQCWSSSMSTVLWLCLAGEGVCFAPDVMLYGLLSPREIAQLLLFRSARPWTVPIFFTYPKESYQRDTLADFLCAARESYVPRPGENGF